MQFCFVIVTKKNSEKTLHNETSITNIPMQYTYLITESHINLYN